MSTGLIVGVVVVLVVLALAAWMTVMYNGLVRLRQLVNEAWAAIDVELKRRHDLIPNLVETVRGYAGHEQGVFEEVTRARAAAVSAEGGPIAARAAAENALTASLRSLFAVAEAYPNLKAVEQFQRLSQNLTLTEDKIESVRSGYNARVREYNTMIQRVPANMMAGMMGFHRYDYFAVAEAGDRGVPGVAFGG